MLSRIEQNRDLGTVVVTDASANPGNSGGPLADECGDVIGIIVAKLVAEDVEGIACAVAETTLQERIPGFRNWDSARPPAVTQPQQPAGPSAWTPFDGESIRGRYVGAYVAVEISEYS